MSSNKIVMDFLVIGSGIAGLTFAIKASKIGKVCIVTKKLDSDSNTNYAQGGIASVLSPEDSFEEHINDTLKTGSGLCNKEAVEILVKNGPDRINELIEWGTHFSLNGNKFDLGREGGHSFNRIAHSNDLTGQEIESALLKNIRNNENIHLFQNHTAVDLLTQHQLKIKKSHQISCYGAYILDNKTGVVETFIAKTTFIAAGGAGQVYLHTTNPSIATGDGIAMAYRAGALIGDMEFFQFHPTALYSENKNERIFLISEAVRGEGGVLINSKKIKIMEGHHPLKDLAPRDVVARVIDAELKRTGEKCVFLDISFKDSEFIKKRFPAIYDHCLSNGIDITTEPIPVVPAAHYLCGGIITDTKGRSSIQNLFVSGESACTGVHGANRLASNSLLEGIVFSNEAFEYIKENYDNIQKIEIPLFPEWDKEGTFDLNEWILVNHNIDDVKRIMWNHVGIVRSDIRLNIAYKRILMLAEEIHDFYKKSTISPLIIELRNLATVAKLIIKSAMKRNDSVGLHYNIDHQEVDENPGNVVLQSEYDPMIVPLKMD